VFRANADYLINLLNSDSSAAIDQRYLEGLTVFGKSMVHLRQAALASLKAFINQIDHIEVSVRPDHEGNLHFSIAVQAETESQLSIWISNQRNQPSRLLSVVRSPESVF
jgi:hypothetical protein